MTSTISVLFVGSDIDSAAAVARSLEAENDSLTVTVAPGASEGLNRLRTETVDCVVSEYDLPETDGVSFLEAVRETYPHLPFVLYTDAGDEDVAVAAISADITAYLQKEDSPDQHAALADEITTAVADSGDTVSTEYGHNRLEGILKTVPSCVVELDANGQFIYANQRAKEVLGLDHTEVLGQRYNDPEWKIRDSQGNPIPDEQLPYRQVWDSGEPLYDYQHSIQWPDGSEKVLSVSGAPLLDDEGNVERVVFSLADITEREERERELHQYKQIVENLDDVATIIGPDGTITFVSRAVERVLGYEPSELIGGNGFGYQPPETSEAVAEAIEQVIDDPDEPQTVQTKFRRADGSWRWVESTMRNRLEDDVIDGILVSSRDITERQEQKNRLQERERQLSQLHEATRELIESETPREVAKTASRTAVEILDFPLNGVHFYDEEMNGLVPIAVSEGSQELFDEVPVIDDGITWNVYQEGEPQVHNDISVADEVYNPESPVEGEINIPLSDRGVFIISATQKDAFEETDIEFAQMLAANTEAALKHIRKEQQLQDSERELEQQNERLEEFASIVSHDLRNPLNVANLRVDLLGRERDSEHLEPLEQALDRMDELISDTLTLARHGNVVAETEPIQLRNLIQTCWNTVSTAEATIEIVDTMRIQGDRSQLQHVFENLFRNAIEHGGAAVTIRVGQVDEDGIYVEDTGPGIPEASRDSVFEPGHTTTTDGTGFGLTIVKRIVEAQGWDIEVCEGTDGGTRFEFTGVEILEE
jgi:PAS domain S-box-containing protein